MFDQFILPVLALLPFLFVVPVLLLNDKHSFKISVLASAISLILSICAVYVGNAAGMSQLQFSYSYINALGTGLSFQMNDLTQMLVLMTSVVFLAAAISSSSFIKESKKLYNSLFLLALGSSLGLFLSGSMLFFYVFWEIGEVAMFFIIYVFGGYDRKYAAVKFLVYSIAASLMLLIGIILLYTSVPVPTFALSQIAASAASIPHSTQLLVFVLLALAFMIKIPVFPFHGWLPDAHTEAPTPGSMILAGTLLKYGGYGLFLLFLIDPVAQHYAMYLAVLFGFSAVYAAFVAIMQNHLKRAIAYISIIDMGIVAIGLAALNVYGNTGAFYGMLSHGFIISLLFLLAGAIDESFGTLLINRIRGVAKSVGYVAYIFLFAVFALIGLPLTTAFVADIFIFSGAFTAFGIAGLAPLGAILILAAYLFWILERMFFNTEKHTEPYASPGAGIKYSAALLVLFILSLGIFPFVLI